jgi:mono/diheme cytochrome c family protein
MTHKLTLLAAIPLLCWGMTATAGDAEAGKTAFEANCADCHYPDDFAGESAGDIMAMIKAVKSGEVEHKGKDETAAVSDADLANIAAYWASAQ